MALGSIFLGGLADKIGRRPTVLGCLVVMANMLKESLNMSLPRVMRGSSQVVLLGGRTNGLHGFAPPSRTR